MIMTGTRRTRRDERTVVDELREREPGLSRKNLGKYKSTKSSKTGPEETKEGYQ